MAVQGGLIVWYLKPVSKGRIFSGHVKAVFYIFHTELLLVQKSEYLSRNR